MSIAKIIKNNKLEITVGLIALAAVFFLTGFAILAFSDGDNIVSHALSATGIVENAVGNDLPTGWHDFNVNEGCAIVGWATDPDSTN